MKKISTCILIFIVLILSSCSNNDELNIDNSISSIEISTGDIYPAFNPDVKNYYISSLNALNSIQVKLQGFDTSKTIYINNIKVTSSITNIKLNKGENIEIKFKSLENKEVKYTINYIPQDMPKINIIAKNNPSDGYIFINLFQLSNSGNNNINYIAILDNDGFPVYYKKTTHQIINFKYFLTTDNKRRFTYNDHTLGKVIVMDENFNEIKQLELLAYNGHGNYPTDNHDFIYLNDNHYIIPTYYTRNDVNMTTYGGSNSLALVEFLFQEIKNNQVIFEWNTADYPELLSATDPIYYAQYASETKVDYFHFNSIAIDPIDQNFVISARHTNQIYKINRKTGDIIWRFGSNSNDFNLNGAETISHPHHATILKNGNLLLFDNGVTKNPQQTRIAEFNLDQTNHSANLAFEYKDFGRYFDIMGSVQKLKNGNYFIGWGGNINSQTNANKSDITEIAPNGNILLDISFSNYPNNFTYSYRALKYENVF